MSFQTIKKPQAERDIEECFVYIAEDNLDIGVYFLVAVEETLEIISKNPFIGKIRESKNSELTNSQNVSRQRLSKISNFLCNTHGKDRYCARSARCARFV